MYEINQTYVYFILVEGEIVSSIGKGLCVLIGINRNDGQKDLEYMYEMLQFFKCSLINFTR